MVIDRANLFIGPGRSGLPVNDYGHVIFAGQFSCEVFFKFLQATPGVLDDDGRIGAFSRWFIEIASACDPKRTFVALDAYQSRCQSWGLWRVRNASSHFTGLDCRSATRRSTLAIWAGYFIAKLAR